MGAVAGSVISDLAKKAKTDRVRAAGKLLNSPEFQRLVSDVARGEQVPRNIERLARSPRYRRWAAKAGISNPGSYLQGIIQGFNQPEGQQ